MVHKQSPPVKRRQKEREGGEMLSAAKHRELVEQQVTAKLRQKASDFVDKLEEKIDNCMRKTLAARVTFEFEYLYDKDNDYEMVFAEIRRRYCGTEGGWMIELKQGPTYGGVMIVVFSH